MGISGQSSVAAATNYAVWILADSTNSPGEAKDATILDPCLALMKHLMSCRNQTHIQNVICSRFSLDALMKAREIIFTYSEPNERYVYRGPNKVVNVRDRSTHAFEGIFSKLSELDAKGKMPIIACTSEDMGLLLSLHNDPVAVDDRFRAVEKEVRDMKQLVHELTASLQTRFRDDYPLPSASAIQPATRERLLSDSNKRRRTEGGQVPGSDSEGESQLDEDFVLPRHQQKKAQRLYSQQLTKRSLVAEPQDPRGNLKKSTRPKATWGKSSTAPSDHLSGPPPEIFMMNCKKQVTAENVKQHFEVHKITLVDVKLSSHGDARKHSFILTVSSRDDYTKIMSGDLIPQDVGVRQYFQRRFNPADSSNQVNSNQVNEFLCSSSVEKANLEADVSTSSTSSSGPLQNISGTTTPAT